MRPNGVSRSLLLMGVILVLGAMGVSAEVFNAPALHLPSPFGAAAVAPSATATIEASHFFPTPGSQLHNYHFQSLANVLLYRNRLFALSGSSVLLFEMERAPANQWYFWASAILTDLSLEAEMRLGSTVVGLAYHHGCEHDLDTFRGRQPISDSLEATITPIQTDKLVLTGGLTYYLPPVFQAYTPLADLAAASISFDWQPVRIGGIGALFVQGNFEGILKSSHSVDANWMLRSGFSVPTHSHGFALYGEVQRLTDDWVAAQPTPVTLWSFGILLGATGLDPGAISPRG